MNRELKNAVPISLQLTLAIIKPHAVKVPGVVRDIRNTILSNNFYIIQSKEIAMAKEVAERFYKEHEKKFFYNRLVSLMTSGPSHVHILAKENAIQGWRELMGPTKVYVTQFTHPESIRGKHGLSDTRNAVHGSDSEITAAHEIEYFFSSFNFNICKQHVIDSVSNGTVIFDKKNFVHRL